MIEKYQDQFRKPPYKHQVAGIRELVREDDPERVYEGCFALFDEMRLGKTKQVIDSAQILFHENKIDRVIVVCPNPARSVWADPEFGELHKHLWMDTPSLIVNYHGNKPKRWLHGTSADRSLVWYVTNYENIRNPDRLFALLPLASSRTLLVCDESSAIGSYRAKQTKAVIQLRRRCGRVFLLNGTPSSDHPFSLYSQGLVLDPRIINAPSFIHFRARYAIITEKFGYPQVLSYQNLEDLRERLRPYCLRRLMRDCLDMPPALEPVVFQVPLSKNSWQVYKDMKRDLMAWLSSNEVATASQAGAKAIRLAQICAGFVGGIEKMQDLDRPLFIPQLHEPKPLGDEKLAFIKEWTTQVLADDHEAKILFWVRFRQQLTNITTMLKANWPSIAIGVLQGGQKDEERRDSLKLFNPKHASLEPAFLVGTIQTGSMSLDLSAGKYVFYASNDVSLRNRLQSEQRVSGPNQKNSVWYGDLLATGPAGEKTIEHVILKALQKKEELATWTASAWIRAFKEEEVD